jgi:hypothetical protein
VPVFVGGGNDVVFTAKHRMFVDPGSYKNHFQSKQEGVIVDTHEQVLIFKPVNANPGFNCRKGNGRCKMKADHDAFFAAGSFGNHEVIFERFYCLKGRCRSRFVVGVSENSVA